MAGKGVTIGLKNLVFATLVDDPATGTATYNAPVLIRGAISANINPNSSNATLFADDGPFDTASSIGEIGLELNVADLDLDVQSALLGHSIVGGVLIRKSSDTPPWLAVGFKSLKSNGSYRYTWLAKGKFSIPEQSNNTKADSVEFQTPTISGSFVKRDCDDEWERHIDEDHSNYIASMGTNWFNSPYGGAVDNVAPTVTVVPANAATTVAIGSAVVWTFNKAMALNTLTTEHFAVFADVTGVAVAGALSVNGARTIVTFTPSANLAAATAYRAVVTLGAKSIAGVSLVGNSVTKFTTA